MLYALIWGLLAGAASMFPFTVPFLAAHTGAFASHLARLEKEGVDYQLDDGTMGRFLPEELVLLHHPQLREETGVTEEEILARIEERKKPLWQRLL